MGRFGFEQELMLSLLDVEDTYGTFQTPVDNTNFLTLVGYAAVAPEDGSNVITNKDEVHGSEMPTLQEVIEKRITLGLEFPMLSTTELALCGLAMGDIGSTKDGAFDAYKHNCTLAPDGTELFSVSGVFDPANRQVRYKGLVVSSFEISSEQDGTWSLTVELMTDGTRSDSSDTVQTIQVQKILLAADTKIYWNQNPTPASDWIAVANLDQATDNISAAQSLSSIGARVKSWKIAFNNNAREIRGHGGSGANQDIERVMRTIEVEMVMEYLDDTERGYFDDQTPMSLEFNCKRGTTPIDAGGAFIAGAIARVAQIQLAASPEPTADVSSPYEITLTGTVMDDGTNPFFDITFFDALAAYFD